MSIPVTFTRAFVLLAVLGLFATEPASAQVRKARVGDATVPFTLSELDGKPFDYRPPRERPTLLVFVAAHQKRSERAAADLARITAQLRRGGHPVDVLLVISGGKGLDHFRRMRDDEEIDAVMLVDADDVLWGRFGVAVTPTTILVDASGRISWVRAGHSYDFAVAARNGVEVALGLTAQAPPADDAAPAAPPIEDVALRVDRHLRLGRVLAHRGRVDAGIAEIRKADALTPNAAAVRLELAHLLCRDERPVEALAAMKGVEPSTTEDRARSRMLAGWAHRQLGDLDEALSLLESSLALDPARSRALFELGKIHEERGDCDRAMATYREALEVLHDEMRPSG